MMNVDRLTMFVGVCQIDFLFCLSRIHV